MINTTPRRISPRTILTTPKMTSTTASNHKMNSMRAFLSRYSIDRLSAFLRSSILFMRCAVMIRLLTIQITSNHHGISRMANTIVENQLLPMANNHSLSLILMRKYKESNPQDCSWHWLATNLSTLLAYFHVACLSRLSDDFITFCRSWQGCRPHR